MENHLVKELIDSTDAIGKSVADSFIDGDDRNIVNAIDGLTRAICRLGNADAATSMGGLEALGATLKEAINDSGGDISDSIRHGLGDIAEAIDGLAKAIQNYGLPPVIKE